MMESIICPNANCSFEGESEKKARGSLLLCILLLFCFLIPGILYLFFMRGYKYLCPKCGMQIRSDSPFS